MLPAAPGRVHPAEPGLPHPASRPAGCIPEWRPCHRCAPRAERAAPGTHGEAGLILQLTALCCLRAAQGRVCHLPLFSTAAAPWRAALGSAIAAGHPAGSGGFPCTPLPGCYAQVGRPHAPMRLCLLRGRRCRPACCIPPAPWPPVLLLPSMPRCDQICLFALTSF